LKYSEFEKAVETLGLCTKVNLRDLKLVYKELSKEFHPDMPNGDSQKFDEIAKAYNLLKDFMENYRFRLDEEEFLTQFPSVLSKEDWLSGKVQ